MKIYNNKCLPEAGKCFCINKIYKLTCDVDSEYEEVDINQQFRHLFKDRYTLDDKFEIKLNGFTKRDFIHRLFSNDDQIAILLNYQQSKTTYNKEIYTLMQDWRKWISETLQKI